MKPRKKTSRASTATPKPRKASAGFVLTPAEREVEAIRKRRRDMWRDLGSIEAIEAYGAKVREERRASKSAARKRSA